MREWQRLALTVSILFFGLGGREALATVGQTLSVQGQPELLLKSDSSKHALGPGDGVETGDRVDTNKRSTAKIHLIDESILDVHPDSSLVMPRLIEPGSPARQVLIEVLRGKIRTKVNREIERTKGRFEIHSYAAALGVEGTDFVVEVIPPGEDGITTTTVTVLEGQVTVRSGRDRDKPEAGHVTLTEGMSFTATAKVIGEQIEQDAFKPEDIRKIDAKAIDALTRAAKLDNETFLQSVSLSGGGAGFGFITAREIQRQVKTDSLGPLQSSNRKENLFRKRFRDDQFSDQTGFVNLSIGFP